ncbi:hypothetical protein BGW39_006510 [Mortierella sp. 14UC]|nr:hypothetical protein BGW39_006510 [Mortierella sp. 14UC]
MALVQSLALSASGAQLLRDEHDTQEQAAARGISYILFYAIFGNLVRWSYGFTLLVPKNPKPSLAPSIDVTGSTRKILRQKATTALERIRQVLTPPLFTVLLALVIGLILALLQLTMGADSKFYAYVIRPIEGCGTTAIPIILPCLGAQVIHLAWTSTAAPDRM